MALEELHIQRGIAQNGPPIEVRVNGGNIIEMTIDQDAVENYTAQNILELIQAAGISVNTLLIPFPEGLPFNSTFQLVSGTYIVEHQGEFLSLPEDAFQYFSSQT